MSYFETFLKNEYKPEPGYNHDPEICEHCWTHAMLQYINKLRVQTESSIAHVKTTFNENERLMDEFRKERETIIGKWTRDKEKLDKMIDEMK